MSYKSISSVTAFCDETKIEGRPALGIVLIPHHVAVQSASRLISERWPGRDLIRIAEEARERSGVEKRFHFGGMSGRTWSSRDEALSSFIAEIAPAFEPLSLCGPYDYVGCKAVVCRYEIPTDRSAWKGNGSETKIAVMESVLRSCIKGALRRFYNTDHQVLLSGVVYDNRPHARLLSAQRVIHRIVDDEVCGRQALGSHIRIATGSGLTFEQPSSDHTEYRRNTNEYCWANQLQVADVVLGVLRHIYWYAGEKAKRDRACASWRRLAQQPSLHAEERSIGVSEMTFGEEGPRYERISVPASRLKAIARDRTRRIIPTSSGNSHVNRDGSEFLSPDSEESHGDK